MRIEKVLTKAPQAPLTKIQSFFHTEIACEK